MLYIESLQEGTLQVGPLGASLVDGVTRRQCGP
jgi:hypothetical protein